MANKQDSNLTGLSFCEETSPGVLPAAADQHWVELDPNSYTDFGNDVSKVSRKTINPRRKVKKGGVTDVDASAGYDHDMLLNGLLRVFRGFFFTDGDQAGTSDPLDLEDRRSITVAAVDDSFTLDGLMTGVVVTDSILWADGFTEDANNGLHDVVTATSTVIEVTKALVDETAPSTARIRHVGHTCPVGSLTAAVSGDYLTLTVTGSLFSAMNINVGDTIFIGGDSTVQQFDTLGTGYARVVLASAGLLLLKDFTGTPAADTGAAKTIQLYFPGTAFRDEPEVADIVRRSYQMERTLGEDDNGPQAEYLLGAIPNELTMTLPEADKITMGMAYVGLDRETIDGTGTLKTSEAGATKYAPEVEDFVNTSTDIFVARLVADVGQANMVGYLENLDVSVSNGVTPNKAVGVVGAFDFSAGDFTVTGSVNAYFDSVAVMESVRDNDDVALQVIGARDNQGFALAMPLVTLAGGQAQVESDQPIMVPLDLMAASGPGDVTLAYNFYPYLPTVAMA